MKLRDNLYNISGVQQTPESVTYSIQLNRDCIIYEAHFPGMPITPGVCIVQIAEELLSDYLQKPLQLTNIRNAKFLSILKPTEHVVQVHFKAIKQAEGTVSAQAVIDDGEDTVYAKISFTCNDV
jgi:3-hydroxyacyl-[acyl-carrier-protein] dehydratase